jgi:hypothetical protein
MSAHQNMQILQINQGLPDLADLGSTQQHDDLKTQPSWLKIIHTFMHFSKLQLLG